MQKSFGRVSNLLSYQQLNRNARGADNVIVGSHFNESRRIPIAKGSPVRVYHRRAKRQEEGGNGNETLP